MSTLSVTLDVNVPVKRLEQRLQRSADRVGHCLRAISALQEDKDRRLPNGVIAAMGANVESHVPEAGLAMQLAPALGFQARAASSRTWILKNGLSDLVTAVGLFLVEARSVATIVRKVKAEGGVKVADVNDYRNLNSDWCRKFDKLSLPAKLERLRQEADVKGSEDLADLEARLLTLNKARNCFEHRGGIVGQADTNESEPPGLLVRWVALSMTAIR